MQRRTLTLFLFILVLTACAAYIIWPHNPGLHIDWLGIHHPLQVKQGLDLQGGVRVLLVPDPAQNYSTETLKREIDATRVGLASMNRLFACKPPMDNPVSP